jgi:hypothetical protein
MSGGVAPHTFSTNSTLTQNGLTFTPSTGGIAGTPTTGVAPLWAVLVRDAAGTLANVNVTILVGIVQQVSVTPLAVNLSQGTVRQFTATALFTHETSADVTSQATWTLPRGPGCSGSNVTAGAFTATNSATGDCTVKASAATGTVTRNVTVATADTGINITPGGAITLMLNAMQTFSAVGNHSGGQYQSQWGVSPNDGTVTLSTASGLTTTATCNRVSTSPVTLNATVSGFTAPQGVSINCNQGISATTCSRADVNAVINGPTHRAVDGDIILIPAGTCTWSSGITVPGGIGVTIQGAGTPNSLPSQMGSATLGSGTAGQTTLIDHLPSRSYAALITMSPTVGRATGRMSMLNLAPYDTSGATKYGLLFQFSGTCSASGCPNVRIDNINVAGTFTYFLDGYVDLINVFGVSDHNTLGDLSHPGWIWLNINHPSWQGVGLYGDNSWATPDTTGTSQAFYVENNVFNNFMATDTGLFLSSSAAGGARFVCRFNQTTVSNSAYSWITPSLCQGHGTETGGRLNRSFRHDEAYGNTYTCNATNFSCFATGGFRGGTGIYFGNTINGIEHTQYELVLTAQRRWRSTSSKPTPPSPGTGNFGMCDGTGPFDTNDGGGTYSTIYYQGTIASVNYTYGSAPGGVFTVFPNGTPGWTADQFDGGTNYGTYSFHDIRGDTSSEGVAGPWGTELATNTTNSVSTTYYNVSSRDTPHVGDRFQVLRATVCLDQPGRGQGLLIRDTAPVLASTGHTGPDNQALDPIYILDENVATSFNGGYTNNYVWAESGSGDGSSGTFLRNRDFYTPVVGQTAQTDPTHPFNGRATAGSNGAAGAAPGVGWGPKSLRPPTCQSGVAYLATDEGTWNRSGNSFGQGVMYICTNDAWPSSPSYVPYQYPHLLVTGGSGGGQGGGGETFSVGWTYCHQSSTYTVRATGSSSCTIRYRDSQELRRVCACRRRRDLHLYRKQ